MKILIADDHSIVRRGLKNILLEEYPTATIDEVDNGHDLIIRIQKNTYDIVISDVSMPGKNGLEALKILKKEFPIVPVLILSIHPEELYAMRMIKAGAAGYITKESATEELVNAVKLILQGKKYITSTLAEKMIYGLNTDPDQKPHELLSNRELLVLKMIAGGKTVSEVASELGLSVNTISTYRSRILEKMNMKNNSELTYYVISNHILD